jgi:hypothetical protein
MGWLMLIGGGLLTVTPGFVNPYAPITGLTILGLAFLAAGVWKLTSPRV